MTTTNLFVELLVIGVGALFWLLLLGATALGYHPVEISNRVFSVNTLLPLLALTYLLGIVTDRVADWFFGRWDKKHLKKAFKADLQQYYEGRRTMALFGQALWEHLEYGRSRLRICRGWTLNAAGLLISLDLWLLFGRHGESASLGRVLFGNVALALLAFLCFWCWSQLNEKEYRKISRQSVWLNSVMNRGGVDR